MMRQLLPLLVLIACIRQASGQTVPGANAGARIDSLKNLLGQTTQPIERYKLLAAIGDGYYMTGIGENSADNNLEMLRIALRLKDDSLIGVSYNKAGDFFLVERFDFNTAIDYFFKGIPYAEKSKDKRSICSIYLDLALAYYWAQNAPEQIKQLKKAESNFPATDHPYHDNLLLQFNVIYGGYYLMTSRPDSALTYLNAADELNRKLNFPAFGFFLKSMFGNLYEQLGDKELAGVYFRKGLSMDSNTVYPFAKVTFKNAYTRFLINSGRYPEAIAQARDLQTIGVRSQNDVTRFFALGFLKTVYDKERKVDSAYSYSKQESALRDTIFSQERLNKTQALAFNEEIRFAEEQSRIAEERQLRTENIQYALIALCILVLLSLYLLLSRSFITSAKLIGFFGVVVLMIVFEFLNLLLHPFLEGVTQHSPVLMLLALVGIAALLVPLHHKVQKLAISRLVQKNKEIRLSAARKTIRELDTAKATNGTNDAKATNATNDTNDQR
jgi:tetratricopeptide (TPR) repeat protein